MENKEEYYKNLKTKLEETTKFPAKYMFKFIVPAGGTQLGEIEKRFNHMGAVINTKNSKTGKYTSISIVANMDSSDAIIDKYKELEGIQGIISL
ncbi:DUF493 family protein [Aureivirga sp. CE67]|uniref:DUF493 family protein n=1 Tax=Aureivirga sp. CE67 TaxID=1788983 RepID=UPI0018CAD12F|nr:DUF493 family protein [Aureivirga sp. CE67]